MASRPYMRWTVVDIEQAHARLPNDDALLDRLIDELSRRRMPKAKVLRRSLEAVRASRRSRQSQNGDLRASSTTLGVRAASVDAGDRPLEKTGPSFLAPALQCSNTECAKPLFATVPYCPYCSTQQPPPQRNAPAPSLAAILAAELAPPKRNSPGPWEQAAAGAAPSRVSAAAQQSPDVHEETKAQISIRPPKRTRTIVRWLGVGFVLLVGWLLVRPGAPSPKPGPTSVTSSPGLAPPSTSAQSQIVSIPGMDITKDGYVWRNGKRVGWVDLSKRQFYRLDQVSESNGSPQPRPRQSGESIEKAAGALSTSDPGRPAGSLAATYDRTRDGFVWHSGKRIGWIDPADSRFYLIKDLLIGSANTPPKPSSTAKGVLVRNNDVADAVKRAMTQ